MSLARTALRLAAIRALETHPVLALRCPGRVYDSRIGDFNHREPVPVIIVTTEELSGDAVNPQNGGTPFFDACDLVLEIAMAQFVEIAVPGQEALEPCIARPETDRELEAGLDLIEFCAEWILTTGRPHPRARQQTPEGRLLNRTVVRRVGKRTSSRFASDDTGERLAIHLLTFRVELKGEDIDWSKPAPTGPYAVLPDPLRTVAEAMPAGSSGALTCQLIADDLAAAMAQPAPPAPTPPLSPPAPIPGTLPVTLDLPATGGCP